MSLAARYLSHILVLTRRFGVDDEEVLEGLSLDDGARVPTDQLVPFLERARRLTGEPGLGVYLGLAMRATWHGYLGFAVLAARDIREALRLAQRFLPTVTPALGLSLETSGGEARVTLEAREDFGAALDFVLPAFGLGLSAIADSLTGRTLEGRLELALPLPDWFGPLSATNPRLQRVHFGRRAHQLVFDEAFLAVPFAQADVVAQRLAAEQCERELNALQSASGFAVRVRSLLFTAGGVRDVDAVAKALATSARTLKRRLADEQTSYSELLEAERRTRAEALLQGPLSVKEVAAQLGYADTAAFSHAFTRWNGVSPSAFQRARGRAASRAITD